MICLTCLYPHIFASLYPNVCVYLLVSSHRSTLISSDLCAVICILASSYSSCVFGSCIFACNLMSSHRLILSLKYFVCLLVSSYPHILIFLRSCTLVDSWYPRILTSSYPYLHLLQVILGILIFSHLHILRFQCSYLFRKLESDETMVLTKKTAFMETKNGSNKFLTK